jgi:hypothetical protein
MTAVKEGGRLFTSDSWFDYTDRQLDELIGRHGIGWKQRGRFKRPWEAEWRTSTRKWP